MRNSPLLIPLIHSTQRDPAFLLNLEPAGGKETKPVKQIVFLVDDSPNVLEVVGEILRAQGYEVETCNVIDRAFEAIKKVSPNLILLDVMMPSQSGEDGFSLCARIKEAPETSNIPVIFLTGIATDSGKSEEELQQNSGADDFINKPFEPADLVARVKKLIK